MADYTKEQALAMFTKWRHSKTELNFQQYFELSKADFIKILKIIEEEV